MAASILKVSIGSVQENYQGPSGNIRLIRKLQAIKENLESILSEGDRVALFSELPVIPTNDLSDLNNGIQKSCITTDVIVKDGFQMIKTGGLCIGVNGTLTLKGDATVTVAA